MFYLTTYSTHFIYSYMVEDHSDSERRNPLPPHRQLLRLECVLKQEMKREALLLFDISSQYSTTGVHLYIGSRGIGGRFTCPYSLKIQACPLWGGGAIYYGSWGGGAIYVPISTKSSGMPITGWV